MSLPRILIGTPTYEGKNYCLEQFIDNVLGFTYPKDKLEFVIFDNSPDNTNALYINKKFGIKTDWRNYDGCTIFEKLADTHERIRKYAINNHFDFLFHLESDVFPQEDIIEQLLWARKPIISPLYFIGNGAQRHLVTRKINLGEPYNSMFASGIELGHFQQHFVDGTIKTCLTNGIGCILIKKEIFQSMPFRYEKGTDMAPDSFFTNDLYHNDIRNWVHTGLIAFHWNDQDWGSNSNLITTSKNQ